MTREELELQRSLRHDLRTPVNHIIGYSEMLLEEAEDAGQAYYVPDLQRIREAGKQVLTLINDHLDPRKTEEHSADLELMLQELRTPLNAIIGYSEMLQEEAAEQGQEHFVPDLRRIQTAAGRLFALTSDSLDFSKLGTGKLDPQVASSHIPGGRPEGPRITLAHAAASVAGAQYGHGSLLVVDDNEGNRDMLSRRLQRQGYTVSVADNGRRALEMVQREQFDLVLLDIMMPEMSGYEVLEHLKADNTLRHIPVIVLSALDELDSVVTCIELGAEDYLPKPFDPVLLRARISASLEKKRLHDQEVLYLQQIEDEKRRSDNLLRVILPDKIVEELKATNTVRPRRHEGVAVLFADIVGFTPYCDRHEPQEVLPRLQHLVEAYEELVLRYHMQKIKTIGDAFMATAGLLETVERPVLNCVECGVEMIATAQRLPEPWNVRVGIHVGPVVAGVLGHSQYLFDLWGDTVNVAARLESIGTPGSITLSKTAWQQVSDRCYAEALGTVPVKGKGELEVFRFNGFKAG
ncbi:MAG: response regulator [Chloroflexota bacterium]|nr:response regulator [Chloroflexota bacterium]